MSVVESDAIEKAVALLCVRDKVPIALRSASHDWYLNISNRQLLLKQWTIKTKRGTA
jgi:hypothetical protein